MPQIDIDGAASRLSADNIRGQSGSTITIVSGHNLVGSGSGLTALNASNLASGTVPTARLGSGTANNGVFLRGDGTWVAAGSTSASDLTSGTLPMARLSGTLPALNGSALTALPAANLTGTLPAISGASLTNLPAQTTFAQAPVVHHQTGGGGSLTDSSVIKRYNGLTVDITPTSSSNKVLIYVQQQQRIHQGTGAIAGYDAFHNYLNRGDSSTTIGSVAAAVSGFGGTITQIWEQQYNLWTRTTDQVETAIVSYWYLDSPNRTTLCRYFPAVSNSGKGEHISWKVDAGTAQMYAMEIKL